MCHRTVTFMTGVAHGHIKQRRSCITWFFHLRRCPRVRTCQPVINAIQTPYWSCSRRQSWQEDLQSYQQEKYSFIVCILIANLSTMMTISVSRNIYVSVAHFTVRQLKTWSQMRQAFSNWNVYMYKKSNCTRRPTSRQKLNWCHLKLNAISRWSLSRHCEITLLLTLHHVFVSCMWYAYHACSASVNVNCQTIRFITTS